MQDTVEKDGIFLRFSIITKNEARTRVADITGDLTGSSYENYLDVSDIKYLLFDKDKNFLADMTATMKIVSVSDDYSLYSVQANIKDSYFLDNLNGFIDFYLLVLANHSGWDITIPSLTRGDSMETLFTNGLVMNILPETNKLQNSLSPSSESNDKQYFPMSGLQHYRIPGSMLMTSAEGAPYDLSIATKKNVNLLRAFAKIEIIDKINIKDVYTEGVDGKYFYGGNDDPAGQNSWLRIDKVEINGFMNQGSLIPSISQWINSDADETQQVKDPTIPSSAQYILPTDFPDGATDIQVTPGAQSNMFPDEYATQARTDKCPVFSGYVFEYSALAPQLNNIANTQKPYLSITTRGHTDAQGNQEAESMTYYIRLANYTNGAATSNDCLDRMLRNHIYRFVVTGISQDIQVYWTVCNMDNASANINFGEDTSGVTNPNKPE